MSNDELYANFLLYLLFIIKNKIMYCNNPLKIFQWNYQNQKIYLYQKALLMNSNIDDIFDSKFY